MERITHWPSLDTSIIDAFWSLAPYPTGFLIPAYGAKYTQGHMRVAPPSL